MPLLSQGILTSFCLYRILQLIFSFPGLFCWHFRHVLYAIYFNVLRICLYLCPGQRTRRRNYSHFHRFHFQDSRPTWRMCDLSGIATRSALKWNSWRTEVGVKCRGSFLALHQLLSKCPPARWSHKSDKRTRDKYFSSLLAFLHFGGPLWPNQSDFCLMLPTTQLFCNFRYIQRAYDGRVGVAGVKGGCSKNPFNPRVCQMGAK